MQYMILRRATRRSESGRLPATEADLLFAHLQPSTHSVRLTLRNGEAQDDSTRFTPEQRAAEQRIRAEQLEAGMRAQFTA